MAKTSLTFQFIFPVVEKKIDIFRPGGVRYEHHTDLIISGIGYKNSGFSILDSLEDIYDFDLETILYEGKDVLQLLTVLGDLDQIHSACFHHIHHLFIGERSDYEIPQFSTAGTSAKVIRFPSQKQSIK